ncbi:MAG: hypothetical protein SPI77_06720 [Corynebacterium sp.]|nr:hypothetical protein [Corynebacterium sp.]
MYAHARVDDPDTPSVLLVLRDLNLTWPPADFDVAEQRARLEATR